MGSGPAGDPSIWQLTLHADDRDVLALDDLCNRLNVDPESAAELEMLLNYANRVHELVLEYPLGTPDFREKSRQFENALGTFFKRVFPVNLLVRSDPAVTAMADEVLEITRRYTRDDRIAHLRLAWTVGKKVEIAESLSEIPERAEFIAVCNRIVE